MRRSNFKVWPRGVAAGLLLALVLVLPVRAGEPDKTIGGINTNLYVCATPDHRIVDTDADAFTGGEDSSTSNFDSEKVVDLDKLEEECDDKNNDDENLNARVEVLQQTRIEGTVFEFHPDPSAPGGWQGVPSRDVPVIATGVGFEIFWGSEKDGFYYFDYLGAGPITLNLRLPPDAHPLNQNITVESNSFAEVWQVPLGFYRGDMPPPDVSALVLPAGYPYSVLPPPNTTFELDEQGQLTSMPSVGGVLPQQVSLATLVLAVVLGVALPVAGILKMRRSAS